MSGRRFDSIQKSQIGRPALLSVAPVDGFAIVEHKILIEVTLTPSR